MRIDVRLSTGDAAMKRMSDNGQSSKGLPRLIAEDEYFLANDLERELEIRGANIVGPYSDFEGAYLRAAGDHFDVAIIDINLHDEKAYPVADELVRQHIPFVFCTGYSAKAIPKRFAGVKLWQKPFDRSEVVEHIGQLCQKSQG